MRSRWHTAVCLASGPSLNAADVETVKAWRQGQEGRGVVVANTTFRIAPWADALFAMDLQWWQEHRAEVDRVFRGLRFSTNQVPQECKVSRVPPETFKAHNNSGAGAIALACTSGAKRVLMLGYDCQKTGGKAHWHGDHPKTLGNAGGIDRWPAKFEALAADWPGVEIINCSRETALEVFPRMTLEQALEKTAA